MAQTKDRPIEKAPESRSAIQELSPSEAAAAYAAQMKRNVEARARTLEEFGFRSSVDVNASGIVSGHVFSVRHHDAEVFPGFQFDEQGRPLPVIAEILALLRNTLSPWQIALWFTGSNLWLRGERPVDVLRTAPASVIEAARHEVEELVF